MTATAAETTYFAAVVASEVTKTNSLATMEMTFQRNLAKSGAAVANAQRAIDRANIEQARQAAVAVAKDTLRTAAGELAL
jgi:hypothetical protein